MPEMSHLLGLRQVIDASSYPNLTSLSRSTVAKDTSKEAKFQGQVSADTKRFLEIEWREGKNPTLLTWNDLANYCVEKGLAALVEENQSAHGRYVVSMVEKKRKKDAEEALKRIEYEVEGWVPREEKIIEVTDGTVTRLRRVEGDGPR